VGRVLIAALIIGGALVAEAQIPPEPVKVRSVLLASNRPQIVALVRRAFQPDIELAKLETAVKKENLIVERWGDQGIILIDPKIPPLAEADDQLALLKALPEFVRPDFTIRLEDLKGESGNRVREAIDGMFPWQSRPRGFDLSKSAFGLDFTTNFTINPSQGGSYRNAQLPMDPSATRQRNRALDAFSVPQRTEALTEAERAKLDRELMSQREREELKFTYLGWAKTRLSNGLAEFAKKLDERLQQLGELKAKAADSLLAKLGLNGLVSNMPKGKVGLDELSPQQRQELDKALAGSWQSIGFSSLTEAKDFLANGGQIEMSLNVGLYRSFSPFDAKSGKPGTGMSFSFSLIRP